MTYLFLFITLFLASYSQDTYKVINTYPHLTTSYTQGLVFIDSVFYEGTGQRGESVLMKVDPKTGKVIQRIEIPKHQFGEGISILNDKIYQLTWHARTCYIYEKKTFKKLDELIYPAEGWGLTNDGEQLILSDGTSKILFLEPDGLTEIRSMIVYDTNGQELKYINELEYIDGLIYANIYTTNRIVAIDPYSGVVIKSYDLTNLFKKRNKEAEVLNGIAYDPKTKHLFVTGKYWSKLFEIELN